MPRFRSWSYGSGRIAFLFRIGYFDQVITPRSSRWDRIMETLVNWSGPLLLLALVLMVACVDG